MVRNRRYAGFPDHSLYGRWRGPGAGGPGVWLAIIIVGIVAFLGICAHAYYQDESVTFKLVDKERVAVEGGGEYRLYTGGETFVLKDTIVKGRLDSADEYGVLQEGATYQCKAFGVRVPLFSSFRNVHDCTLVSPAPAGATPEPE